MTVTNGYATRAELAAWLNISGSGDDAKLDDAINAASRAIDRHCGRRFWKDSSDVTRAFTAESSSLLRVPDLASITSLKTDTTGDRTYTTTWATGDYDTEPVNGYLDGFTWPIRRIVRRSDGDYSFPSLERGVQIVGKFGWDAVPDDVKQACLIWASRLFKRKDAPFGVAGTVETGQLHLARLDPDVRVLLAPLTRMVLA